MQGLVSETRRPYYSGALLESFEAELEDTESADDLSAVMSDNLRRLGFSHFAYMRFSEGAEGSATAQVLTEYPPAWRQHYVAAKHFATDPAIWSCTSRVTPVAWHELMQEPALPHRSRRMFDEAQGYGLCDGVATPLHGAGPTFAVLNAATDLYASNSVELIRLFRNTVHMMAVIFHIHAERCLERRRFSLPRANVSSRQVRKMLRRTCPGGSL